MFKPPLQLKNTRKFEIKGRICIGFNIYYIEISRDGDIVVYSPILERRFELSSMGVRVDKDSLLLQLETRAKQAEKAGYSELAEDYRERTEKEWHKRLLEGDFPLSIGGGIGQSRLCMYLLDKAHVGEVQASIWPDDMMKKCEEAGIRLL